MKTMREVDIVSTHNPRIKRAAKLRGSRQRAKLGRCLIDGCREIARALDARVAIEELFVCAELCDESGQGLVDRCAAAEASVFSVSRDVFDKLAFGERAEGLLAVAVAPRRGLADVQLPPNPLVAVLEGVEKPGNVGAVLRSADAAGVDAVLIAEGGTDLFNPNTIRASLGTVFTVPTACADSAEVVAWLRQCGIRIFAARVNAAVPYTQADFTGAAALVLGSEAAGLSDAWSGTDVTAIRLPMRGAADSLNVSAAAAVLFYEALRQRSK
jgi:TrmH family RNA methyltransferase